MQRKCSLRGGAGEEKGMGRFLRQSCVAREQVGIGGEELHEIESEFRRSPPENGARKQIGFLRVAVQNYIGFSPGGHRISAREQVGIGTKKMTSGYT